MKNKREDTATIVMGVIVLLMFIQLVRGCSSKSDTYNGWHKDDPEMNRIK